MKPWIVLCVLVGVATSTHAAPGSGRADPPAGEGALAPNLVGLGDAAMLSWLEPARPAAETDDAAYRLRFATFSDGSWSPAATIVERSDFFANWADVPSMARAGDGSLFAHWPQKSGDATYAYDVMLARSRDGGRSWGLLGPAHDDRTQTEHGFVSLVPEAGGVRAFWLDGRAMAATHSPGDQDPGAMTVRTALIGASVGPGTMLDARVCECCSTSAAVTDDGSVIVYRDRGPDEVRDISIVRRVGDAWSQPKSVHDDGWLIAACPVNGPAVAARGRLVVVAWFTGAVGNGVVRAAFSTDAGQSFTEPVTIDDTWPIGRVAVVLDESGDAIVCWLDTTQRGGAIMLRRVSPDRTAGTPLKLVAAGTTRAVGFPRMVRLGASLLVAWTEEGETTRLRAMTVPAADVGR